MAEPDLAEIDLVFRLADRVVWIVTAAHEKRRSGLVATWVNQCSIDPSAPLALVGLAPNHFTAQLVDASGAFCLHLIASEQIALAWRFGLSSGRDGDKFAGLPTETALTGAPVLSGSLAWLDCRVVARYDAGDRLYFWADVVAGRRRAAGQPVTESHLLAAASPAELSALQAGMAADRKLHQPLRQAWRDRLPSIAGQGHR